jgi:hypothetical protein
VNGVTRRAGIVVPIFAFVLLAAMVTLAGCGGSGSSDSTAATTAGSETTVSVGSDSLKPYSNAEYGYSFNYPEAWEIQEGTSADVSAGGTAVASVGVFDPDGAVVDDTYVDIAEISVYELTVTIDDSVMAEIKTEVEAVLSSLETQAPDIETVEGLAETTVNGMKGFTVTYSLTKSGAPVTTTLYFLFSGNMEYQVTVQASQDNWDELKPTFSALVASFKPTAG